jgi:S-adenosyl methyltransferase
MTHDAGAAGSAQKPATAARMYDYYLGGIHNFPADQDAAREIIARYPFVPAMAQANRAFLGRAVRHLVEAGVRQFLDIGSGIPTAGNVHEIAQGVAPESRVVYVDVDPVAVAESLDLLAGNDRATAIRADLRSPQAILEHQSVRRLLNLREPVGLLMAAVMHFVPDDTQAYDVVRQFVTASAPGSYLVLSHTSTEIFLPTGRPVARDDVYTRHTTTPGTVRTRSEVERFFTGTELLAPGVVWTYDWRPDGDDRQPPIDHGHVGIWAGVGRKV